MTDSMPAPHPLFLPRVRFSRSEVWIISTLTVLALALRLGCLSHVAIEHFDEAVYASNLLCGPETDYIYPAQHLYAPPLQPALVEWTFVFLGPSNWAAFLPDILCGTLTIPAAWWLGRSCQGPIAGLAAAAVLVANDFHCLLSCSALTEAPLGLFMLLAMVNTRAALLSGSFLRAVIAGLCIALAWWTKYNGWLPLSISALGLGLWFLAERPTWREAIGRGLLWATIFAVACLAWAPCLWLLQKHGGYVTVMRNHSQYIGGVRDWWPHLLAQVSYWWVLSGSLSVASLGLACGVTGLARRFTWNGASADSPDALFPTSRLGLWIWRSWFWGLLILTPFYRPYVRLTLLWMLSAVIGIGWLLAWLGPRFSRTAWFVAAGCCFCLAGGMAVTNSNQGAPVSSACEDRLGMKQFADQVDQRLRAELKQQPLPAGDPHASAIVYVYGEPAVFFHLRLMGWQYVVPINHLRFTGNGEPPPPLPTFLVAGPHAVNDPRFLAAFQEQQRLQEVATFEVPQSTWVGLDDGVLTPIIRPGELYRLR